MNLGGLGVGDSSRRSWGRGSNMIKYKHLKK